MMFLCTYIVLKASSCVTFGVFFATRASIVCIDSGTCDTIRVLLALAMRFFDISINRYTPIHVPSRKILSVEPMLSKIIDYCQGCHGVARKNSLTFPTLPTQIPVTDAIYILWWFFAIYSKPHRNHIFHQSICFNIVVLKIGQHKMFSSS